MSGIAAMKNYEKLRADMEHLEKDVTEAKKHEQAATPKKRTELRKRSGVTAGMLSMRCSSGYRRDLT